MEQGTVKFFNEVRGYGFIKDEAGKEIFVHASGLNEAIKTGDVVQYEIGESKKGPLAENVSKV